MAVLYQRPYDTRSCKCRIVDQPIKSLVRPREPRWTVSRRREKETIEHDLEEDNESLEGTIGNAACRKCLEFASFLSISFGFFSSYGFVLSSLARSLKRRKVDSWVATIIIIAWGFERSIDDLGFAVPRSRRSPLFLVGTRLLSPDTTETVNVFTRSREKERGRRHIYTILHLIPAVLYTDQENVGPLVPHAGAKEIFTTA